MQTSGPGAVVRYRGFVLIAQEDLSWLVRPQRSPMHVLPFRAPTCSVADVKALIDWRLARLGRDRKPKLDLLPGANQHSSAASSSPSQQRLNSMKERRSA